MRKRILITLVAGLLACIGSYAQEDAHLVKLTNGVKQLRKAKSSADALNKTVIDWSASDCPKITLMDEVKRDADNEYRGKGANKFRLNQVVTYVYNRQNVGLVSKGDFFNSTEKNVYYSAIEKNVKKDATVTYTITDHAGRQEFVFIPYNPKTKFKATVNGLPAKSVGDGVQYIKTSRVSRIERIVLTITNLSSSQESFVILNHNPQR